VSAHTQPHEPPPRVSLIIPVVAGLLGALAMTVCLGPSLVDPTNIDWLMHADYRLHFLGWHLYRNGPWTLPVGASPLLIWPVGSSVGLTDAIPLVALPLKLLASVLPAHFQFIGLWLVLSFALQGVFGALLMQLATPRPVLQLLGATVFILSPPLIFRILHAALTAHWLVLAALWLSLRSDADVPSRRLGLAWACLCAAAAATQPYIMLMIVLLMLAACARQVIAAPKNIVRVAGLAAVAVAASGLALWQSGSLMVSSDEGLEIAGFGGWSANLLTFVMPLEAGSRFGPGPLRYANGGQYEGYAYLGAGTLLLGLVVIAVRAVSLRSRDTWWAIGRRVPFILALLVLAAMAVGPTVTFGPRTLFTYDSSWWGPLTIFRTHGRMIWPLYYAVTAGVLFAASRFPYRRALVACALAVVMQAVDVSTMSHYVRDLQAFGFRDPLQSRFWNIAAPHYRQLVLIPSNLCTYSEYVDYSAFSLLAGRYGLGINAGITARYDVTRSRTYCGELAQEIRDGMRANGSLYIVRADLLPRLAPSEADGTQARCTVVDGFGVCFSPESYAQWRDGFDVVRSRLPSRDEFVRFYEELNATYRTALGRPPREAPATADVRVEGLVRYLSYRMEGCSHADAESRTLQDVDGVDTPELCPVTAINHELPPADQTYAFAKQLDRALREEAGAPRSSTHVDLEGEAVWLQAYARERAHGVREQDARTSVLAAIKRAVQ
jgi:hypothetical protein